MSETTRDDDSLAVCSVHGYTRCESCAYERGRRDALATPEASPRGGTVTAAMVEAGLAAYWSALTNGFAPTDGTNDAAHAYAMREALTAALGGRDA